MANDGFTKTQLSQLQSLIPSVEQIRDVVKEEVRSEVASQLSIQLNEKLEPTIDAKLKSIHEKLDEIRGAAREDADALAKTTFCELPRCEIGAPWQPPEPSSSSERRPRG